MFRWYPGIQPTQSNTYILVFSICFHPFPRIFSRIPLISRILRIFRQQFSQFFPGKVSPSLDAVAGLTPFRQGAAALRRRTSWTPRPVALHWPPRGGGNRYGNIWWINPGFIYGYKLVNVNNIIMDGSLWMMSWEYGIFNVKKCLVILNVGE